MKYGTQFPRSGRLATIETMYLCMYKLQHLNFVVKIHLVKNTNKYSKLYFYLHSPGRFNDIGYQAYYLKNSYMVGLLVAYTPNLKIIPFSRREVRAWAVSGVGYVA